jgi:hypothetical protein
VTIFRPPRAGRSRSARAGSTRATGAPSRAHSAPPDESACRTTAPSGARWPNPAWRTPTPTVVGADHGQPVVALDPTVQRRTVASPATDPSSPSPTRWTWCDAQLVASLAVSGRPPRRLAARGGTCGGGQGVSCGSGVRIPESGASLQGRSRKAQPRAASTTRAPPAAFPGRSGVRRDPHVSPRRSRPG